MHKYLSIYSVDVAREMMAPKSISQVMNLQRGSARLQA